MPDTTSELFHRLKSWESGRKLLNQEETVSTCSQVLLELLEKAGLSAPEWMTAADVSKSYGYQILRGGTGSGAGYPAAHRPGPGPVAEGDPAPSGGGWMRGTLSPRAPGRRRDLRAEPEDEPAAGGGAALLPAGAEPLCRGALTWESGNSF